jgi:nucleoside-diphosphate-sugar epimerase
MPQTKILITGAAGFIGQLLSERFLSSPDYTLILTDIITPPIPPKAKHPGNARSIKADLSEPASLENLLESALPGLDAIYVFHGIMSSGSEADFELGMRVNLSSTMALLEGLRKARKPGSSPLRVIYASSQPPYPEPITGQHHLIANVIFWPSRAESHGGASKKEIRIHLYPSTIQSFIHLPSINQNLIYL